PKEVKTSLKGGASSTHAVVPPSSPALLAALATRAKRRAYPGAPPSMPLDHDRDATCNDCHNGDNDDAPIPPHRAMASCQQCHVASKPPRGMVAAKPVKNLFQGVGRAGRGARAYAHAPPVIPHQTQLRGRCLSCHGPHAQAALRTSHPGRVGCLQCHVPKRSPVPRAKP
ncbi:MAG: hypothetical protein KAI47_28080, partial [Deltaproteobacteria bacterium]|nr:hypothetical protein [Deltaproteobacteria bacterium]